MAHHAANIGASKRTRPTRARQACLRCRKQKLRCDNERPCALCLRSYVECEEGIPLPSTRKRARTLSSNLLETPPQSVLSETPERRRRGEEAQATNEEAISPKNDRRSPVSPLQASERHGTAPSPHQERASTYGLVDQLFQKYDSASGLLTEADAIPDGTPGQSSAIMTNERLVSVSDVIGCELPRPEITKMLFEVFLRSVHWFMFVFHEPTLRIEVEEVMRTGRVQKRRMSFLVLILVILAIGTKYATKDDLHMHDLDVDVKILQSKLMGKIEERFLDVFDENDIGSVQVCILLSSIYIFHRQPKRAFVVLGTGIRSAQASGLQKESTWGNIEPIEREVRRRVWWALFTAEGFQAFTFGRPFTIQDGDWHVEMPQNIDDTCDRCPGFDSVELLEHGTYEPVTTLSYQRLKFKLYQIAAPITRSVYFHKGATMQEVMKKVQDINGRLLEWERSVPAELKPSSFPVSSDSNTDPVLRIFQLQAIALQLSYDNIQLILHRPLLAYDRIYHSLHLSNEPGNRRPSVNAQEKEGPAILDMDEEMLHTSKCRCWESAIRTSRLDEHPNILKLGRNTHTAGYAAIQAFTAGVMLGIFALSNPFSLQAQESKRAISRLIKMPTLLGYRTAISDQGGGILEKLLRLILAEEMKLLISDDDTTNGSILSVGMTRPASPIRHATRIFSQPQYAADQGKRTWPSKQRDLTEDSFSRESYQPNPTGTGSFYCPHPELPNPANSGDVGYTISTNQALSYQEHELSLTGNFNDALTSLQHAFRDNGGHNDTWWQFPEPDTSGNHTRRHIQSDTNTNTNAGSKMPQPSPGGQVLSNSFIDTGQAWIWDDSFQFT